MSKSFSLSVGAGLALGIVALVGLGWLAWTSDPPPESAPETRANPEDAASTTKTPSPAENVTASVSKPNEPQVDVAEPPGPEEPARVRPHPPSPERRQLQRERALMEEARGALKKKDIEGLREALAQFDRIRTTDQFDDWYEALGIIADCLEDGGTNAKAASKQFVQQQRGSTMRRSVRKHCGL